MIKIKKISKKQLLRGMNLALSNARSLLREAKLLLANKAYSRGFVFGVLALEEAGKVVFLTLCYHDDRFRLPQKEVKNFTKLFSQHQVKIAFFEDWYARKWKNALYVRKRKHPGIPVKYVKEAMRAWRELYLILERKKLSSIGKLKLKCIYTDICDNGLDFEKAYRPSFKAVKGLLLLTEYHIKDAVDLRNVFRRAKTAEIAEHIYMSMFKSQDLKASLVEIEKAEKAGKIQEILS